MSQAQFAQAMQERERMTWDLLDRLYANGAKLEDLKDLAREAGCHDWRPKENHAHARTASVG